MRGLIAAVILRTLILADLLDMLITNIVCVRNSQYGVSGKQSVLNIWEAVWWMEGAIDIKYNGLACQLSTCHPGQVTPFPPARCTTSSDRRIMATQDPKEESL